MNESDHEEWEPEHELSGTLSASNWNYRHEDGKYYKYQPGNAGDNNNDTAWCITNGIGDWIQLDFEGYHTVNMVRVLNGYQKYRDDGYGDRFYSNSRVDKVTITLSGGQTFNATVYNNKDWTVWRLNPGLRTSSVRIRIDSAIWADDHSVCLNEVEAYGTE